MFLFIGGASAAYFSCSLDLFLHNWDEQYHALVAKNMMSDMFNPILYKNNFLANGTGQWTQSHIWIHKQPLFLWQMALSLKIFGINEIALRLPNIIAHGFLAIIIYDMGKALKNDLTGLLSAILFCYMRFPLTYAAGIEATDHNDYMFLFYVTASFWALFKYYDKNKAIYILLIGLFAGCAIMVKWLTGFLVIGVWSSYVLFYDRKNIIKPITSIVIAIFTALPWQLYCYFKYKSIYLLEMDYNTRHIFEPLDGHSGNWDYHLNQLKNLYSDSNLIFLILGISVIFFFFNKNISFFYKYTILLSIFLVYIFFSIVKTKMPAFCIIVIPLVLFTFVTTLIELMNKIKQKKIRRVVYAILFSQLLIFFFSPSYFLKRHTLNFRPNENNLAKNISEKIFIEDLRKKTQENKVVFMNTSGRAIKFMFYLDCYATDNILEEKIIDSLKAANYKIIAFK